MWTVEITSPDGSIGHLHFDNEEDAIEYAENYAANYYFVYGGNMVLQVRMPNGTVIEVFEVGNKSRPQVVVPEEERKNAWQN